MEFLHAVRYLTSERMEQELREIGVMDAGGAFQIEEVDPRWPPVRDWIAKHGADELFNDYLFTNFSGREIAEARWLHLGGGKEWGYPQPEAGFGFLEVTYDLSEYCSVCGMGARQVAPFRMKSEPRWGRRDEILTLHWMYDVFFVRPETFASFFEPFGVRSRPVVNRKEVLMESVVQLDIEELVDVEVNNHVFDLSREVCSACGRLKLDPLKRGPFPALVTEPAGALAQTRQWFGSGAEGRRETVIRQDLAKLLRDAKVEAGKMTPVLDRRLRPDGEGDHA